MTRSIFHLNIGYNRKNQLRLDFLGYPVFHRGGSHKALFVLLFLCFSQFLNGQVNVPEALTIKQDTITPKSWNPIDSIRLSLQKTPDWSGALDGRRSFVSADPINIFGLRYGFDYGKVGAYTGIYSGKYSEKRGSDSLNIKFQYISSTFEYRFFQTYRYQLLGFAQVGIGATTTRNYRNTDYLKTVQPVVPVELGMYMSVRLLRYFGLAAGMGTRLAMLQGGSRFSGPIYTFGITYFPGTFYRDARKWLGWK